tara:strand:+ start:134 stop:886 length:753 start_codon:yes stop_codon:yes gene_type:complete
MPSKTLAQRQQSTANLLSAGNLWYQRQSAISLSKMASSLQETNTHLEKLSLNVEEQTQIAEESLDEHKKQTNLMRLKLLKEEERELERKAKESEKENLEKQIKYRRDAFFHLKIELEDLENSTSPNLERYFSINSVTAMFKEHNINTELTDDFNEKELIQKTLNKIEEITNKISSSLKSQEVADLDEILDILQDDEELEITNLEKDNTKDIDQLSKKRKKIEKGWQLIESTKKNDLRKIVELHPDIVKEI